MDRLPPVAMGMISEDEEEEEEEKKGNERERERYRSSFEASSRWNMLDSTDRQTARQPALSTSLF